MGQQTHLAGRGREFPLGQPQHEHIVRRVQTHLACAGQHHRIQSLGDVPQVGRAEQQPEQVLVFGHGHGLLPQQMGHLVQQPHDHVPLPGGFLRRRDAPARADGLYLSSLLFLSPQRFQAEIHRPADGLGIDPAHLGPECIHCPHEQGTGMFCPLPVAEVLFGQLLLPKALGAALELLPPGRRRGGPGVGIVFQRTNLLLAQGTQAGLGKGGQVLGQVGSPGDLQQGPHRRGRGAEFRGGGFIAVQGDLRHPELIPDSGTILGDIAADHSDLSAPHTLPHQPPDGTGSGTGLLLPAGRGKEPHLARRGIRGAAAGFQQLCHCGKARGVPVAQILAQKLRSGHLRPIFPGQLAQLRRHLLGPGEQAQVTGQQGGSIIAEGHRYAGQRRQHGPQQPLFGRVEGIELINEHRPVPQKLRQAVPGQCFLQPGSGQLQPVRGVHAAAGQQGLVALKDKGQLTELTALGPAGTGQLCQLLAGKARALQFVDGLSRHLAKGRTAPVAVIIVDIVLQLLQRPAHQHGTACVREGLHRRAALGGKDLFCQTGKRKALHHAGQGIPQLTVDAALGAGSELFRHQQDAFFPFFGPGADALVQQRCFSAAGTAQK